VLHVAASKTFLGQSSSAHHYHHSSVGRTKKSLDETAKVMMEAIIDSVSDGTALKTLLTQPDKEGVSCLMHICNFDDVDLLKSLYESIIDKEPALV
jgi:hypothetical protein